MDAFEPKILGFFCHWCCYAAADAAGVARFQYPHHVRVIRVMCTGRIDPIFLMDGFVNGADGIFVGGWHLGECHYRTGNYEAIHKVNLINGILEGLQVNPSRLSLEWVSAAESPRFVTLIRTFTDRLRELGPFGSSEDLDVEHLMVKFKAAKMALEGKRLRMVIARQAKFMKEGDTYREIPSDHKLHEDFNKTLAAEAASQELLLYVQEKPRSVEELAGLLNLSSDDVIASFNKLEKKKLVESDRLVDS